MNRKILLILIILIIGGIFFAWEIYLPKNSLTRMIMKGGEEGLPSSTSQEKVIFKVEKGEGSKEIALNLERDGLIKWDLPFRVYVLVKDISGNLQAGTYELSPSMTIPQIAKKFASGDTLKIKVTIPEGFTLEQIEQELNSKLQEEFSFGSFHIKDFKNEFDFLGDSPDVASLEGFLFPDTYFFELNQDDKGIVERFLKNFGEKFAPYQNRTVLGEKKIFEIVIMASLIEKEVQTLEDKKLVSGILWKRLENKIPLQVDATISYITRALAKGEDERSSSTTGKKTVKVSIEETKIDSPYNTYKYRGLPIGPISNPGLESIIAAISPQKSDSWYYLSTPEGETIFRKTLEEHNIARAKYLK